MLREPPTVFIGVFVNGRIVTVMLTIVPYRASAIGAETSAIAIGIFYAGRIVFSFFVLDLVQILRRDDVPQAAKSTHGPGALFSVEIVPKAKRETVQVAVRD